ncbi:TPA: EpsG family protein [Yersinia enterocolitica]
MFSLFEQIIKKKKDILLLVIFITLIEIFFYGTRYKLGVDWQNYIEFFSSLDESFHFEVGYCWLKLFFSSIGLNYWGVSFFASLMLVSSTSILAWKFIPYPVLFLTLNFLTSFFYNIEAVRSMIGYSIILFSFRYLFERKVMFFLIATSIATLFHQTMLVFFLFALVCRVKLKRITLFILIIIGLLFYAANISPVLSLLYFISSFMFEHRLAYYLLEINEGHYDAAITTSFYAKIFVFSIIIFQKNNIEKKCKNPLVFRVFYNAGAAYILLFIYMGMVPTLVYRTSDLFFLGYIAAICFCIERFKYIVRVYLIILLLSLHSYFYYSPFESDFYKKYIRDYTSFLYLIFYDIKEKYNVSDFWEGEHE